MAADPARWRVLSWLWSDWRIGLAAAAVLAASFGLFSAWWAPRGPLTTAVALLSMGLAFVLGVAAAIIMGSRWALLVAPVVFVLVFEAARIGVVGPTVDAISFESVYGVVALVLGRLFHGVLVIAPMMLGSIFGVWLAARLGHAVKPPGVLLWLFAGLGTLILIVLAVLIAQPASTAPIMGADGQRVEGSVSELTTVEIGGHEQALMIRGRSADSPVLLYLTGGPGGTDMGAMRRDVGLEEEFVVVTWDQRGAGKSYPALDPTETFTLDQIVSDTIELTDYLRERFGEEKIYLVGQSWGSTLGVLAVDARPDLYHAFVGVGQMVSQRETDRLFWEDTRAWAERTGNDGLAATLVQNGLPPYDDLHDYAAVISYEHEWNAYPGLDLSNEMPGILFVPEYTFIDRVNAFKAFLDTNATLYPQLQGIDFRRDITQLDVPYTMVLGEHEARGRAVLANQWYEMLQAPAKQRIIFDDSGHRALFDRPAEFATVMAGVLAATSDPVG